MAAASTAQAVSIPGMVRIKATEIAAPPGWALLERQLIKLMAEAAILMMRKYTHPGGGLLFPDDVDDTYEIVFNWGLFYAIGADERVLDLALQFWNATTRYYDDGVIIHEGDHPDPNYHVQLHNEYYKGVFPNDWMHQGEGNMAFYGFGLANPTIPENVRRAKRFAGLYLNEDPEAQNYDERYKIIRSPIPSAEGPVLKSPEGSPLFTMGQHGRERCEQWQDEHLGRLEFVKLMLDPTHSGHGQYMGYNHPSTLYPVVKDLEPDWFEHPERAEEIIRVFDDVVLNGDTPCNLAATGLVTNAYLYTGDEKYKRWVLEYADAWLERSEQNNGIVPDNVGPTGQIGEQRQGQWWGGQLGWNSRMSTDIMFCSLTIAAECALLLSGDYRYLDLIRSQLKVLLGNAVTREDGELVAPHRYGPDGWEDYKPIRVRELAHLYHASMAAQDYELLTMLRAGSQERDWHHVPSEQDRRSGNSEYARFQYYDGQNPDWPEKLLRAEYQRAVAVYESIRGDTRDVATIIAANRYGIGGEQVNPVVTKGLTQLTMGAPQEIYTGGLCRAQVRYFDQDRARPGLPPDVAALVDRLAPDQTGIQLVNTSTTETRNVIVQAGAFGEHQFTAVRYYEAERPHTPAQSPARRLRGARGRVERTVPIDAKHLAVELPPATSIHLDLGMRRFVNRPSYAFPWHGDQVPLY